MKPEIRLYKLDKKQKLTKGHYLFGKGDNPGCHNLPFHYKVFKATVIGFEACSVYSEKDCKADSVIPAMWKGKKEPVNEMTRGAHWYFNREKNNVEVASWSCR